MCTAVSVVLNNHYFGRNLDYEHTFGEKICITPRNYTLNFSNGKKITCHYAVIGTALNEGGYPLYFDAVNEKGLCMAGLNFPGEAHYFKPLHGKDNVASFEVILWLLSQCSNVSSAKNLIENMNITDTPFSENMPASPLHWIIADKSGAITLEQTKEGIKVYSNPVGVLTNSPSFDIQMFNLNNYLSLTNKEPGNRFSEKIALTPYSRGMGAMGLPGDNSSVSRFVRAGFVKLNSVFGNTEDENINQFFHILYSVYQTRGSVKVGEKDEITNYSVCFNADSGIYYFTTYDNFSVSAVDMHRENLDADALICYELYNENKIRVVN